MLDEVEDLEGPGELSAVGKMDKTYGLSACERDTLIAFSNSCHANVDTLKSPPYRLSSRARNKFVEFRDGPDKSCADEKDNNEFVELADIDKVKWIGSKTIKRMGKAFTKTCSSTPAGNKTAKAFFSPQTWSKSHLPEIVRLIGSAKERIDIAMYSYRDAKVGDALKLAIDRGVKVRFIYHKAQAKQRLPLADRKGSTSAGLESMGINVRYATKTKVMHHKFVIIDGPLDADLKSATTAAVATGSGNWTSGAATRFDENMIVLQGYPSIAFAYQHEFNTLWNLSIDFVWDDTLPYAAVAALDPTSFPKNAAATALFTSANFRSTSPTFSRVFPRYTVADAIAAEIATAKKSIYVASGHLRSRRVAEALLAAVKAKPSLDVRVYLDGQEYISSGYDSSIKSKVASCLKAATTDARREHCNESGRYFSYIIATADQNNDGVLDIDLRFKYYAYRWDHSYAPQMHNKYVVIDDKTLITGSYNLSHNAEIKSFENTLILRSSDPRFASIIQAFKKNFEQIWETDGDESLLNSLLDKVENGKSIPLVFDPMALDREQVESLKELILKNCPALDSKSPSYDKKYKDAPGANRYCPRS